MQENKAGRPRKGVQSHLCGTDDGLRAEHLLKLFERSGLRSEEVAEYLGVSKNTVNFYLNGKHFPRVDKWRALATVLGLKTINELFPHIPIDE